MGLNQSTTMHMSNYHQRSRFLALTFFASVAIIMILVWRVVRPYNELYFFPVYFLVGLSAPFLVVGIGGRPGWFWVGMILGGASLLWLNFFSSDISVIQSNWAHLGCGMFGLILAASVHLLYHSMRVKHPNYRL